jgi:hypothetical protein
MLENTHIHGQHGAASWVMFAGDMTLNRGVTTELFTSDAAQNNLTTDKSIHSNEVSIGTCRL